MESLIIEKLQHVDDTIDIDEGNLTPIQDFYKDAKVLITGSTGFLGQILIEKLLRSCPISKLYVFMRKKKDKDVQARLDAMFDDVLFDRMKKVHPNFLQKVVIIEGDCAIEGLGLTDQDKTLLMDEVNIVFHMAATVNFDEKLKKTVAINVRATRDLSVLAQQMPHLKSFLHVSTAYSNCIQNVIEEKVYPPAMDYRNLIDVAQFLDDLTLAQITPHFVGSYPNTYIYTKQVTESVVKEETYGLPSGIYRPPIVLSTYKEPIRGWINNFYGATGIVCGSGLGLIRIMYCNEKASAACVPADMCVNGMIATAWDVAEKFQKSKDENQTFEMPVYTYENSTDQPLSWGEFRDKSSKYGLNVPSVHSKWIYILILIRNYNLYVILTFLLHTVPAFIMDNILFCIGKERRLMKAYKKMHTFMNVITYFAAKSYQFSCTNIRSMLNRMSKKDRDVFFFDLKKLDWDDFFMTYTAGARIYLIKDPIDTIPQGKILVARYRWAHRVLITILGVLGIAILWSVVTVFYGFIFNS